MRPMTMAALGAILLLAACSAGDVVSQPSVASGAAAVPARAAAGQAVAAADWSHALGLTLRIRQDEFVPVALFLRQGNAYTLKLQNGDDVDHTFLAPGFFRMIAVKSLTPAKEKVTLQTTLVSIDLPANQTRVLAFVPLRDGSFPFSDGWAGMLLGGAFAATGVVTID